MTGRLAAFLVCLAAMASLGFQIAIIAEGSGSLVASLSAVSQYFTILTNLFVVLAMAAVALGAPVPGRLLRALLVAILGVGIVYHAVLARLWNPQGLAYVADQGLHTVVPAAALLWWLVFAPKGGAGWSDLVSGIVWPILYCVYALTRAHWSGFYPYPFLDLDALGWSGLLRSVAVLTLAFVALSATVAGLDRALARCGRS